MHRVTLRTGSSWFFIIVSLRAGIFHHIVYITQQAKWWLASVYVRYSKLCLWIKMCISRQLCPVEWGLGVVYETVFKFGEGGKENKKPLQNTTWRCSKSSVFLERPLRVEMDKRKLKYLAHHFLSLMRNSVSQNIVAGMKILNENTHNCINGKDWRACNGKLQVKSLGLWTNIHVAYNLKITPAFWLCIYLF